ncbi:uncharacterized protein LOC104449843 isoform X2 [Eucalyptus grandis]|uniref:uncharacterized protein LOC104449843 isoform X2 n=2 Tax=Eucalyptus grandis TaxID=71139 RepID=UPI00192E968D|nr:uncharacterized protein LOC104449843 isoform X2 [Eucalyptus grandis]XP_039162009.1 uncharacterized protein LOC104449843 isoform X2 [Eucalyptus grandis]XP_039162010.1 uncharacterized protein LOC104449843 isoform X2 [Eucalyptus grandis]
MAANHRNEASGGCVGGRGESVVVEGGVECGRPGSFFEYCRSPNGSAVSHGWATSLSAYESVVDSNIPFFNVVIEMTDVGHETWSCKKAQIMRLEILIMYNCTKKQSTRKISWDCSLNILTSCTSLAFASGFMTRLQL